MHFISTCSTSCKLATLSGLQSSILPTPFHPDARLEWSPHFLAAMLPRKTTLNLTPFSLRQTLCAPISRGTLYLGPCSASVISSLGLSKRQDNFYTSWPLSASFTFYLLPCFIGISFLLSGTRHKTEQQSLAKYPPMDFLLFYHFKSFYFAKPSFDAPLHNFLNHKTFIHYTDRVRFRFLYFCVRTNTWSDVSLTPLLRPPGVLAYTGFTFPQHPAM